VELIIAAAALTHFAARRNSKRAAELLGAPAPQAGG
jgi:hypothetical protein